MHMISVKVLAAVAILLIGSTVTAKNMALETNDIADHYLSTNINLFFDFFIKHYTRKLVEEGKTQMEIGGFDRSFSTKIFTLLIEGAIVVDGGLVGNISTLHRTGDAEMDRDSTDVNVSTHLGLNSLEIDYDRYDLSLLGVHQQGKVHVTVGANSLFLKMKLQLQPTCVVSLADLKIEQLDNIEVDITNLGIFENLTDDITSWVINEVSERFRHYVENILFPELNDVVKEVDLCRYIPH